jgi:hypothetical protein
MQLLGRKIAASLGLLTVAVVGALDMRSLAQAGQGPEQVLIVNPAASPAQTTVVGPVTATIANTPGQAIPVTVEGTPSVAVSGSVTVANTEAQAIPVRDLSAARVAWVGGGQLLIDPGVSYGSEDFFVVPPGQRLVIEALSINGTLPTGQIATDATTLVSSTAGVGHVFHLPLAPLPGGTAALDRFGTVLLTKLNVAGGNGVIVSVSRDSSTGTGLFDVALSGYLVAEP